MDKEQRPFKDLLLVYSLHGKRQREIGVHRKDRIDNKDRNNFRSNEKTDLL